MDYFKVFTDSIKLWWNNKFLWIFGIIAVIFGGSGAGNSGSSANQMGSGNNPSIPFKDFNFDLAGPLVILLILLFIFIIAFALLGIYLKNRSDSSLISSIPLIEKGDKLKFSSSWKLSEKNWLKLFLIRLVLSLPIILFSILAVIIALLGIFVFSKSSDSSFLPIIGILFIPFICFTVIYAILVSIINTFASRIAIFDKLSVWESISKAWSYFISNFSNLFIFWVISLLVGFITGPITFLVGLIAVVVLFLLVLPLALINVFLAIFVGIFALIIIGAILSLISGPVYSFTEIYWTKVYLILKK